MNEKELKTAIELINFITKEAEKQDQLHKKLMIGLGKGSQAVGESSVIFYLRVLRELIEKN